MGAFWGSDKVLLAELSLLGRYCVEDEVPLFYWRHHAKQSMSLPYREKRRWIAAEARGATFQRCQSLSAYLRALRGKELTSGQKMRCFRGLLRRVAKRGRLAQLAEEMLVRSMA